jgi:hypothetical protein
VGAAAASATAAQAASRAARAAAASSHYECNGGPLQGSSYKCARRESSSYEGGRCAGSTPRGQLRRGSHDECDGVRRCKAAATRVAAVGAAATRVAAARAARRAGSCGEAATTSVMAWPPRGSSYACGGRCESSSHECGQCADSKLRGQSRRTAATSVMAWPLRRSSYACGRRESSSCGCSRSAGSTPRGQLRRGSHYECDGVAAARQQLRMWRPL